MIGISTDPLSQQVKFTDKEKLTFPLFADPEQTAAKAYGVIAPGAKFAQRATFVIDKDGKIAKVFAPVKDAGGHPQTVLTYVEEKLSKK